MLEVMVVTSEVHPTTGHEGPEGRVEVYLYSFLNLGAGCGWVVNAMPRPLFTPGKDPVPIV